MERLADAGYFQNNREVIVGWGWPSVPRFFPVVRSMTNLEKLYLLNWELTLTEDLPQLFQPCPKLTELRLKLVKGQNLEMGANLKNELRSGFQRLRIFELVCQIGSWPAFQEMFT
jgi:hypothetical protein